MEALTEEDWELITELANGYYRRHGELIKKILDGVPKRMRAQLLAKMSDMSSVYSHDTEE